MDFFQKTKRGRGKIKHAILDRYFKAWIAIMCQTNEWQTPVVYIDGFAGPGTYKPSGGSEEPGSPVVIYQAVTDHRSLPQFKIKSNSVELIFVEKDKKKAEQLNATLTNLENTKSESVKETVRFRVVNEDFAIFLEHILEDADYVHSPMFVFADPFGYKEIPMCTLKKLLERGGGRWLPTEVFITVMDGFARRFISDSRKSSCINSLMGYDNWQHLTEEGSLSPEQRRDQFIELYISNVKKDIAEALTLKFAMRNNVNRHVYHLIFLTCHITGVKQMKTAMWKQTQSSEEMTFSEWVENKSVENEANLLKSPDKIALLLNKRIRAEFTGKRVSGDNIEYFIWVDTLYLPFKNQLKKLLKDCAVNNERSFEKIVYFFNALNSSTSPSKISLKQMKLSPIKETTASTSKSSAKENCASQPKSQLKQMKLCFK